jgi:hypothetical protein
MRMIVSDEDDGWRRQECLPVPSTEVRGAEKEPTKEIKIAVSSLPSFS